MTDLINRACKYLLIHNSISPTLKSIIEEHACLYLSDFLSPMLAIFHVINFQSARLLIYLVNKQADLHFLANLLIYSGLLVYQGLHSCGSCHSWLFIKAYSFIRQVTNSFWCWSRMDYNETYLKTLNISRAYTENKFNSFSTIFLFNGSHVNCNSGEEWAETWFDITNQFQYGPLVPCVTNSSSVPVATFLWRPYGVFL